LNIFKKRVFFSLLAFIIPFTVYLITLAPGLYFIDTGELATVCVKLGIAHPTGYPLFTLLGNIFSRIPAGEYIYNLNMMCAFFSSVTSLVFFNLMYFILTELNLNDKNGNSGIMAENNPNQIIPLIISLVSSLVLAFSNTFWNTSNSLEVYSLHTLLVVSIIYSFLYACNRQIKDNNNNLKYWIFFGYILGLSFTNHLSTIFLSVGTLYLYFTINGINRNSLIRILIIAVPFIGALTVYFYFFARGDNQIIAWGNPVNLENFYRHVSGKQFSIWMFSSTDSASKQFSHFLSIYPKEFFYIPVIISIPGIIFLFNKQRKFFYYTVILFIFNILYAINYDIHDINTYFLLSFIITAIWFGTGFYYIYNKFNLNISLTILISLIIVSLSVYGNFDDNNLNGNQYVKEFTENVFKSTKGKSIIISTQWDFWVSPSFYYQYVFNEKPEITVLDKELMRKSWYLKHIKDHYPALYERSRNEFELYEIELKKFEKFTDKYIKPQTEADKQNLIRIQNTFMALLNSIIKYNSDNNIYITFEVEDAKNERIATDYARIPEGLLFRLSKNNIYDTSFSEIELNFAKTTKQDYYHEFLMNAYLMMFLNRANYLMNFNRLNDADNYIKRALDIRNNDRTAMNLLKKLNELKNISK
jgi:hypothetical protein